MMCASESQVYNRTKMKLFYKRRLLRRITTVALMLLILAVIFITLGVPLIFKLSSSFQKHLVFLNLVYLPIDFDKPEKVGLLGTRNLYIESSDNVRVGVWHTLPAVKLPSLLLNSLKSSAKSNDFENWLGDGNPIFLYVHGNSGTRGSGHRLELYKVFQNNNYHVIAFDYRSYGDSSRVAPSESGVVNDTVAVYRWIKSKAGDSKIFFWGHSLGTSISSNAISHLEREGENIAGLVLESPFTNMEEELYEYPMAKVFSWLPWFHYFFIDPLSENGLKFQTDRYLSSVKVPILILHAEDDMIVPYKLGRKLYQTLKRIRGGDTHILKFISYAKNLKYGHKYICKDPQLPTQLKSFVRESSNSTRT